jgi:hypothetical protein
MVHRRCRPGPAEEEALGATVSWVAGMPCDVWAVFASCHPADVANDFSLPINTECGNNRQAGPVRSSAILTEAVDLRVVGSTTT